MKNSTVRMTLLELSYDVNNTNNFLLPPVNGQLLVYRYKVGLNINGQS
jgi:hypothetical protein